MCAMRTYSATMPARGCYNSPESTTWTESLRQRGSFRAIINVGALSIVAIEKPSPPGAMGFVEKGTPAAKNAFRKVWARRQCGGVVGAAE